MLNMLNKPFLLVLVLILVLILVINIPTTMCSSPIAPIVYVDTDGSGDYNCDGTDDHVEINKALQFVANKDTFTTVHLNGANVYWVSDTVFIGSNTILEGDSDAIIKLISNARWPQYQGMVEPIGGSADNIIVQGFEIDGNKHKQTEPTGISYYTMLLFDDCTNVIVRNMYLHHNRNDAVRVHYDSYSEGVGNINIYNNNINECGHDGVYLWRVSNANIYNNTVTPRTNTGIRATESNHISIYNNTISPGIATGGSGILIQKARANPVMDDIEIYNNIIHGSNLCGIHLIGYNAYTKDQAKDVHIHRNIITGVGRSAGSMWNVAGIAIQGFHNTTIENNVINGCYMDGIATNFYITGAPESGYVTIVRNNIVTNTHERLYDATGTGNGIANHLSDTHSFVLENNDVWNNVNENYYKTAAGLDDVQVNPLFADISNHDYHLKSAAGRWSGNSWITDDVTSPLIDAGHPKSDYSNEPAPIVGRINIGRYGNTAEASKSVSDQPITSAGIDQTVTTGDTVTLDGSASTDDVGITSYVWDFDDSNGLQQDATGAAVQHTYNMAGTYTATLTVTDGDGNADFDTVAITVNERFITPKPNETISSTYDNRLREASPDLVLYYNDYIDIGHNTDVGRYRDVMWFNLSMYNTTDTISTATLSLYWYYPEDSTRNKDTVVEIYRPVDWDPDYVNWNSRTSDTPWNTPGGDWFDMNEVAWGSVSYASVTFTGTDVPDNRFYEFDVTELVQDYISGKYGNTGFFLKAQDEYDNYISFYSSDYSNADQRPKLTVTQNHALV